MGVQKEEEKNKRAASMVGLLWIQERVVEQRKRVAERNRVVEESKEVRKDN